MRVLYILLLGLAAGEDYSGMSVASTSYVAAALPSVSWFPPISSCPYANCQACVEKAGCGWIGGSCVPCGVNCPFYQKTCSGCISDYQCGPNMRCDNGQCLRNAGDIGCDFVQDCWSCLRRPNCLWDPNTLTGSCKPKEQCDFTYQARAFTFAAAALPPASACVSSIDRCAQRNFDGTPLVLNPEQGVGCTNHGQCRPGEYCYSCSKCRTNCDGCRLPGAIPVSGMCGPAWRCPIDQDSISETCPPTVSYPVYPSPVYPVVPSCAFSSCGSCTAQYGCVWSGSYCYYSTSPCYGGGCANTPSQCGIYPVYPGIPSSCNYYDCQSCTAANGCVWSGSYCYYSTSNCFGLGCANYPSECGSSYPVTTYPVTTYPRGCFSDAQCAFGQRCSFGACVPNVIIGSSCDSYFDCVGCLSNPNCLWDPNVLYGKCKPKEQCDFTYRALAFSTAAAAPPATACVRTVDRCWQTNFNGAILDPNYNRGLGCTNHGQCRSGEYCFSCTRCRGDCSVCFQGGISVSGACGPSWRCPIDGDSIDYTCPTF